MDEGCKNNSPAPIFHIVRRTCQSKTNLTMFSPQLKPEKKNWNLIRCHCLDRKDHQHVLVDVQRHISQLMYMNISGQNQWRKTIYQLRPHLSQMRTTKYMPFTRKKAAFWQKCEPIGPYESATGQNMWRCYIGYAAIQQFNHRILQCPGLVRYQELEAV